MIAEVAKSKEQERETDALEEEFFSTPPEAFATEIDGWDATPMSASNLVAMRVTIAMLVCCALSLLGFAALSETVLVHPVKLGAAQAQELPTPAATASFAPAPAAAPLEPAARPEAPIAAQAALAAAVTLAAVTPAPQATHAPTVTAVASEATAAPPVRQPAAPVRAPLVASPAAELVKRAHVALGQGQAQEAQQLANEAIRLDPKHARSYIVLGGARDALGDSEGVRAAFRDCVERASGPLVSTCKTLAR
jgi:hypothetical protein